MNFYNKAKKYGIEHNCLKKSYAKRACIEP